MGEESVFLTVSTTERRKVVFEATPGCQPHFTGLHWNLFQLSKCSQRHTKDFLIKSNEYTT